MSWIETEKGEIINWDKVDKFYFLKDALCYKNSGESFVFCRISDFDFKKPESTLLENKHFLGVVLFAFVSCALKFLEINENSVTTWDELKEDVESKMESFIQKL